MGPWLGNWVKLGKAKAGGWGVQGWCCAFTPCNPHVACSDQLAGVASPRCMPTLLKQPQGHTIDVDTALVNTSEVTDYPMILLLGIGK